MLLDIIEFLDKYVKEYKFNAISDDKIREGRTVLYKDIEGTNLIMVVIVEDLPEEADGTYDIGFYTLTKINNGKKAVVNGETSYIVDVKDKSDGKFECVEYDGRYIHPDKRYEVVSPVDFDKYMNMESWEWESIRERFEKAQKILDHEKELMQKEEDGSREQ